jgi:hypothetical protein
MLAAFRGEMFKVVRRPAVWVSIGMLLLLALLIQLGGSARARIWSEG